SEGGAGREHGCAKQRKEADSHRHLLGMGRLLYADSSTLAVVAREVLRDRFLVLGLDWRAEGFHHLRHHRIPSLLVEERRIQRDVVEAVAGDAVLANLVQARAVLELHLLLARERRDARGERHAHAENAPGAHHTTSRRIRWTTLW